MRRNSVGYQNNTSGGMNPYAVGNKVYGGSRSMPSIGPNDPTGYRERDQRYKARREAIERRLKARKNGKPFSADAMRTV